jgi:hypothetical protein
LLLRLRLAGAVVASLALLTAAARAQSQDQFKKAAQAEFLKTQWRATRDLPVTGWRKSQVDVSVTGPKKFTFFNPKGNQDVPARVVSSWIHQGDPITVRKIEFVKTSLAFEVEGGKKERLTLFFSAPTYAGFNLEKFKENILCHFLVIDKYEAGRALDDAADTLSEELLRRDAQWNAAAPDAVKLDSVRQALTTLEMIRGNRVARQSSGKDQSARLVEIQSRVALWRKRLVETHQTRFDRDIAAPIGALAASDNPPYWAAEAPRLRARIDAARASLNSGPDLTEAERALLTNQLAGYGPALSRAESGARERVTQRLDSEYNELTNRVDAAQKAFAGMPDRIPAEMARKIEAGDGVARLAETVRSNRARRAEASGNPADAASPRTDAWVAAVRAQQATLLAAKEAAEARIQAAAAAAELKKLDAEYTSLDFDYAALKAKGAARAALSAMLSRLAANRQRAVALGSARAKQHLQRIQKEQQALQK